MYDFPRTPSGVVVTTNGTVEVGARSVDFVFSSDFEGTLCGVPFDGANDANYQFVAPAGDMLGPIPYTVSAGSMRVISIV